MPLVETEQQKNQAALLEELLRQRGLLATGGNIRQLPFAASAPANGGDTGSGSALPSASSASRPAGETPVIDADNNLVNPKTGAKLDDASTSDWWKYLAAGAGVAGGAALAEMLRRRANKNRIPTVEGEVIDPLSPLPNSASDEIINGEYRDAPDTRRIAPPSATVATEPTFPSNGDVAAVAAERKLTARNRPNANPVASSDTSVIRAPDSYSDLSPEEMQRAKELTAELIAARKKGNLARSKQSRFSRRAVQPTGPTEPEEGLLNTVIRLMKQNGALRSAVVRAVP